jgi:integrase
MRGSVVEVRKGVWRVVVPAANDPVTGRRRRIVRHVHGKKRDAEDERTRLLFEVGGGDHLGHDATVAQLVERWFARAELAASTRREYRYAIDGHLPASLASMKIHKVRAHHLDDVYSDMATRVGPDRIRRLHSILSQSFAQAVRWRWVATNPARDASPPSQPPPKPTPPPADAVRKLLAGADDEFRTFLVLSATLGARREEVVGLQWGDVDLEVGSITIRRAIIDAGPKGGGVVAKGTKTGRDRVVAVDVATIAALRSWRSVCAERCLAVGAPLAPSSYLFSTEADGSTPWRPDAATKRFARLRDSVGVQGVQLRQLRHFVATQLLAAGVDPRTVAGRLGHARTSTTTDIYAAFVPARDRDAADMIAQVLSETTSK